MMHPISDNSFASPTPSTDSRQRRLVLGSSRSTRSIRNSPATAGKSIMKKQLSVSVKNPMLDDEEKNATPEVNRIKSFYDDSNSSTSTRSSSSSNSNIRRHHHRQSAVETPPTPPRIPTTTKANVILDGAAAKIQNVINAKKVKQGRKSDVRMSLNSAILLDNDNDNNSSKDEGGASNEDKEKEEDVAVEADSLILDEVDEDTPKRGVRKHHSLSTQLRRRSGGPLSPYAKQRRENQDNEIQSPRSRMVRARSERQQTSSNKDDTVLVVDDDDSQWSNSIEGGSYELKPESTKIKVRSKSTATYDNNEDKNETAAKKSGAERSLRHRSKSRTRDGTRDRSKSRTRYSARDRSKSRLRDGTQSRAIDPNSSTSARRSRRHRSRSSSRGADIVGDRQNRSSSRVANTVRDSDRRRARSSSRGADAVRDSDRRRARSSSRGADAVRDSDRRSRKSKSGDDNDNGDDDNDDDKSVATSATNTTAASRRGRRPPRQKTQRGSDEDDDDVDVDDEDTKSIGSIRSVASRASATSGTISKRGRRPKSVLNTPSTQKISSDHWNKKLLSSPGIDTRKHKDRNKMGQSMSSLDYHFESHPPLSNHLESDNNNIQGVKNLSIVDEEKSIDMSRTDSKSQSILLQFDPTNENGVQTVNQTKAKKTSETIRQSDGTKSQFQISELAGLPTFERTKQQQEQQRQSQLGAGFLSDLRGSTGIKEIKASESNRSMLSSDGSASVEGQHGNRPLSFLSLGKPRLSTTRSPSDSHQNPGEAPEEEKKAGSNNNNKWNNLQAKKAAFIQRVQKSKLQVTDSFMTMNRPSNDRTSPYGSSHQALDDDDDSIGY
jgi:hypothetical protein